MFYISFAPACLVSLGCSLACLLDNSTNSFIWRLWRVWNLYLNCFLKLNVFRCSYRFFITVLFSYFMVFDRWYMLYYRLSCFHLPVIAWYLPITPVYYYLTSTWYYLTSDMWSSDTWHAWYLTLVIITIWEWWPDILIISWHILEQSVLLIQHVFMIHLKCSCSFLYTDNYLINNKRTTYTG